MAECVLNRHYVLSSKGHRVVFEKDVPAWVPTELHDEALGIGAVFVDNSPPDPLKSVRGRQSRRNVLEAALRMLRTDNDPANFTSDGAPKYEAVDSLLGYPHERSVIDAVWARIKAE